MPETWCPTKRIKSTGQVLYRFNVSKETNKLMLLSLKTNVYYLRVTRDAFSSLQKLVIEK